MPVALRYLLKTYLTGLLFFFVMRVLLLLFSLHIADHASEHVSKIIGSLFIGLWFDTSVSGHILLIPLTLFFLASVFNFLSSTLVKVVHGYVVFFYCFAFLASWADIPFFKYFFERVNGLIFTLEGGAPIMLEAIFGDWRYYLYLAGFFFTSWLFARITKKYLNQFIEDLSQAPVPFFKTALIYIVGALTIAAATKGAGPQRTGSSNFSDYTYANKLALNPLFSFIEGTIIHFRFRGHKIDYAETGAAIQATRNMLGVKGPELFNSPLCREVKFDSAARKMNVVLILMESMAAGNMAHFGNTDHLTPFLDSLADKGCLFTNFYSSGTHTNHGIYSTLTGYPCLPHRHSLQRPTKEEYQCLPRVLQQNGYNTTFFTSHDAELDNVGGFCRANGFNTIYSNIDYDPKAILNSWGVPDHYLLGYALQKMDSMGGSTQPFFSTVLTITNHPPFSLPKDIPIKPNGKRPDDKTTQYADWALQQFFAEASKRPWFDNTIFVLVADHGRYVGENPYEFPMSFVHVPLIIYSPKVLPQATIPNFGGQVDVFATIMGLLQIPYYNNSFGKDLLREKKDFAFFCSDDRIGYADEDWFYFSKITTDEFLFKYRRNNLQNYLKMEQNVSKKAKTELLSVYQTAQWMVQEQRTMLKK